ncbi:hypothetical protein Tco_1532550 [Tanacetum coccineum]
MEAHCIALELKYQNKALKSGQHGQILNETSNKAKIKKEIDTLETMNIELEHSVAKLRKENETLKKHYKDFLDSGKVLGKPVLQPLRNQSVVRQPNAFKSERPRISKPWFASQVDVKKDLLKPVTQHYLPKERESTFAKPDHTIASSKCRNSSKNMPRFSSNDMVHNHYLYEARKKTQERDRNSKISVMPYARFQNTADDSTPKPRSTNHSTRSLTVSKSSCVSITAMPKADHSKNSSSFLDSKHFVCSTCHKSLLDIGKLFASCTSKDDSEPTHGSNSDIPNIHECKQILNLNKELILVQPRTTMSAQVLTTDMIELESLFGPLFDEYFNEVNHVVSKSSGVTIADASDKRQQQPDLTSSTSTLATSETVDGNFDL